MLGMVKHLFQITALFLEPGVLQCGRIVKRNSFNKEYKKNKKTSVMGEENLTAKKTNLET